MSNITEDEFRECFGRLRDELKENYSKPIWANLDVLYRFSWRGYDSNSNSPSLFRRFLSKVHFEKEFLKKTNRKGVSDHTSSKILIAFANPCRNGYVPLFLPLIHEPCINSRYITIFTSRKKWEEEINFTDFQDSAFIFEEDVFSYSVFRNAKKDYNDLEDEIFSLAQRFELDANEQHATQQFFKRFYLDKHIFRSILQNTQPNIVFSVQFNSSRGSLAAIDEYAKVNEITKVIIQHGSMNEQRVTTGLAGADWGLLWGEYFKSVMENKHPAVVPDHLKVVGNPNLQLQVEKYAKGSCNLGDSSSTILYPSTPVLAEIDAMRMFAREINKHDGLEIKYKEHPSGEAEKYNKLIDEGLVNRSQIIKDANIYELISDSDVVVGTETTVLPESVALNVPTLQIWPDRASNNFCELGLKGVSNPEALHSEIESLTTSNSYRNQVLEEEQGLVHCLFNDLQSSSQHVSEFISHLSEQ